MDPRLDLHLGPGHEGCFPITISSSRLAVVCQGNGAGGHTEGWDHMRVTGMAIPWQDGPCADVATEIWWSWSKWTDGRMAGT